MYPRCNPVQCRYTPGAIASPTNKDFQNWVDGLAPVKADTGLRLFHARRPSTPTIETGGIEQAGGQPVTRSPRAGGESRLAAAAEAAEAAAQRATKAAATAAAAAQRVMPWAGAAPAAPAAPVAPVAPAALPPAGSSVAFSNEAREAVAERAAADAGDSLGRDRQPSAAAGTGVMAAAAAAEAAAKRATAAATAAAAAAGRVRPWAGGGRAAAAAAAAAAASAAAAAASAASPRRPASPEEMLSDITRPGGGALSSPPRRERGMPAELFGIDTPSPGLSPQQQDLEADGRLVLLGLEEMRDAEVP